jgi:hypothetical protein
MNLLVITLSAHSSNFYWPWNEYSTNCNVWEFILVLLFKIIGETLSHTKRDNRSLASAFFQKLGYSTKS